MLKDALQKEAGAASCSKMQTLSVSWDSLWLPILADKGRIPASRNLRKAQLPNGSAGSTAFWGKLLVLAKKILVMSLLLP